MQDATNNCEELKELLSAYRDLELNDQENARVERHLAACEECSREAGAIEMVAATLSQVPRLEMKVDMADRLEALIAAQPQDEPGLPATNEPNGLNVVSTSNLKVASKRMLWGSLAAAAAVLLMVAVPYFNTHGNSQLASDVKEQSPVPQQTEQSKPLVAEQNGSNDEDKLIGNQNDKGQAPNIVASKESSSSVKEKTDNKSLISQNGPSATPPLAPAAVKKAPTPQVAQRVKTDVALDSIKETEALIAFSSDEDSNMFEEIGISTDEDGLYAIKL